MGVRFICGRLLGIVWRGRGGLVLWALVPLAAQVLALVLRLDDLHVVEQLARARLLHVQRARDVLQDHVRQVPASRTSHRLVRY